MEFNLVFHGAYMVELSKCGVSEQADTLILWEGLPLVSILIVNTCSPLTAVGLYVPALSASLAIGLFSG